MGFGQFYRYILSFQQQANTVRSQEFLCIAQQLGKRRAGPRRHQIEGLGGSVFHADIMDGDLKLHALGCGGQEGAFLGGRLEKGDF